MCLITSWKRARVNILPIRVYKLVEIEDDRLISPYRKAELCFGLNRAKGKKEIEKVYEDLKGNVLNHANV